MRAVVEFTHHKGEKLPKGRTHPRGTIEGNLVSWCVRDSRSHIVSLHTPENAGTELARLYAAKLVGFGADVIRISGLERCGEAWVHQEWICRVRPEP